MFQRYTEKARRVIFFARTEASQFGSPYIESEHLLLGLLREDKAFPGRFITHVAFEDIRKEIERRSLKREKISTSVDLPLSNESKRILAYAAEEADRARHRHIGTEHLMAGILCEKGCFAADLLSSHGVKLDEVRLAVKAMANQEPPPTSGVLHGSGGGIPQSAVTWITFSCGDQPVAYAPFSGAAPRIGEGVALMYQGDQKNYRVVAVTHAYFSPMPPAVLGTRPPPEYAFALGSIIVKVEEE